MKLKMKIIAVLVLSSSYCFAQITMGTISKEVKEETVIPAPKYESVESFVEYGIYYRGDGYTQRCTESEFYKRYIGLEVYYPTYTNDFRQDDVFLFKGNESIVELKWSDLAEKYFTIKNIEFPFEKSTLFNKVSQIKPNLSNTIKDGLLFELEDKITKEIIYVVEFYLPSFVLTEYYKTISTAIPKHTFVAIKEFNGRVLPLSEKLEFVEKGSEWQAEFTLLRKADMNLDVSNNSTDLQNILFMVVLSRDSTKIITYYDSKDYYETLWTCFDTKQNVEAEKQASENQKKQRLDQLTQQYGSTYATDILNHKLTIGMTKKMCEESVGITLNRSSYMDSERKIEVWEYVGVMRLYFTNGKLSNIIKY